MSIIQSEDLIAVCDQEVRSLIIVQKFGGTSMGSVERIKRVADKVIHAREQGYNVVVVVSAMAGETDRLLNLAHEISSQPPRREMDMLLATGEQVSISLLSIALRDRGYQAKSLTGHQVRITTDSFHTKARIQNVDTERIKEELAKGVIVVVAGFQGVDEKGEITTLGRGGPLPLC
jgi:aspartate kinase